MATILVIDDEPAIVDILSAILEDEGYNVLTANNGYEGLVLIAEMLPDLIMCDVMMPLLDGPDMCRTLQTNSEHALIPVILMSAVRDAGSKADCNYAAFVPKPFDLDGILSTIARFLPRQKRATQFGR